LIKGLGNALTVNNCLNLDYRDFGIPLIKEEKNTSAYPKSCNQANQANHGSDNCKRLPHLSAFPSISLAAPFVPRGCCPAKVSGKAAWPSSNEVATRPRTCYLSRTRGNEPAGNQDRRSPTQTDHGSSEWLNDSQTRNCNNHPRESRGPSPKTCL